MADCHIEFQELLEKISLSKTKINNLRRGRDALRSKIKIYFQEKELMVPDFCWQGSFSMKTTIVQSGEDYDLDDGIYLTHLPESKSDWPTTEEIHNQIIKAVDGHTETKPKDKASCIRIQYKNEFHIDLAIYSEYNDKIFLAKRGDIQWEENNPKLFKEWFETKLKKYLEQFRSVCKYIKKWAYYNGYNDITGFLITILVGNNFYPYENRDDKSLSLTLCNIVGNIESQRAIIRPVPPYKNMLAELTEDEINSFIHNFAIFSGQASLAVENDKDSATKIWENLFGEFPHTKQNNYTHNSGPSYIKKETEPWGE